MVSDWTVTIRALSRSFGFSEEKIRTLLNDFDGDLDRVRALVERAAEQGVSLEEARTEVRDEVRHTTAEAPADRRPRPFAGSRARGRQYVWRDQRTSIEWEVTVFPPGAPVEENGELPPEEKLWVSFRSAVWQFHVASGVMPDVSDQAVLEVLVDWGTLFEGG